MGSTDPTELINLETHRTPFKNTLVSQSAWKNSFRSWPTPIAGWRDWYRRVSAAKSAQWDTLGISHCIGLSLAEMERNEPLLASSCYFWSDALNAFLFSHGPMSPTLMDVTMLTDLDVTTTINPWSLRIETSHRLQTKGAGGWSGYMSACKKNSGPVSDREHVAFLNMWLERFVFCGSTLGPTTNFQGVAETLASGRPLPLGVYLLGATYRLLHQVTGKLRADQSVGHFGGPWWFLQLWLTLYTARAIGLPPFSSNAFPSADAEDEDPSHRRCMSLGEATAVVPGRKLSDAALADWFKAFYYGFARDSSTWFAYEDLSDFEVPFSFRPDTPLADAISAQMFIKFIKPCLLPTGIASGRSQHPSYEFYNPSACARQLGLGQLPIGLFYADKLRAREPVRSVLDFDRIMQLADNIPIGDFADLDLAHFNTRLFSTWWREWKKHLFCIKSSTYLAQLDLPPSDSEVSLSSFDYFVLLLLSCFNLLKPLSVRGCASSDDEREPAADYLSTTIGRS